VGWPACLKRTLGPAYHKQEQLLNALNERDGIDAFVASFSAVQKESGDLVSYCVWGRGPTRFSRWLTR
jgi:hypothetical protein